MRAAWIRPLALALALAGAACTTVTGIDDLVVDPDFHAPRDAGAGDVAEDHAESDAASETTPDAPGDDAADAPAE